MKQLFIALTLITPFVTNATHEAIQTFDFEEPELKKQGESTVYFNPNFNTVEGKYLLYQSKISKKRFLVTVAKNLESNMFTDFYTADGCTEKERENHERLYLTYVQELKSKINQLEKTLNIEQLPVDLMIK